jgi:hypothetical protein
MKTPRITVTFDKKTGIYIAEEITEEGLFGAFGSTPEEAMQRLELGKALCDDCEDCRAARGEQRPGLINPYVH